MAVGTNDDAKLAGAFRPDRRPVLMMVFGNLLLAGLFLGAPWLRESARVEEVRDRFAAFAACLYGGEALAEPGLGLPAGDTAHFAYLALRAGPQWPGRCRPALLAVAPVEARFLLPSAAAAEHDVRRAVDLVRRELDAFDVGRRTATHVTTRPLRAIALLRAELAQMVAASGFDRGMGNDALRFPASGALIEPTRLPLRAASDAPLYLEARGDGLIAFALDQRGLGIVRLGAGSVDVRRLTRPRGVQGVVHGQAVSADNLATSPTIPWLVSLTSEARCVEDPARCARRTMGLAPIGADASTAPTPWLLAAHPWGGAIDDTVRVLPPVVAGGPPRVAVLARTVDAGPELRVFVLDGASPAPVVRALTPTPTPAAPPSGAAATPLIAESRQLLDLGTADLRAAQLLPDARSVLLVAAEESLRALIFDADARSSHVIGELPIGDGAMLRTCVAGAAIWVALASSTRARLIRVDGETPVIADALALAGGERIDDARSVLRCDSRGALLVTPLRSGGARLLACDDASACHVGVMRDLPRTAAVAAARDDGAGIVAYATRGGRVQLVRVDRRGRPIGASVVPAACWDDGTGLCGAPALTARNGRILLVTREGMDLRALETVDGGATWGPLRGLL